MNTRLRTMTALLLALLLTGAGVAYAVAAAHGTAQRPAAPAQGHGQLYYRAASGEVMAVRNGVVSSTHLRCVRFAAGGSTRICLTPGAGPLSRGSAVILDSRLREVRRYELAGIPSRAQVSRSGRMVAWTVFVVGDSYAGSMFATWTSILDTRTGDYVANIESLGLTRGGKAYYAIDLNYWGVTFAAGDDRFYATAASKGRTYLVQGSVGEWAAHTVREGVECPSISPDGTRLAFKRRTAPGRWRLAVLDLASGRVTDLAERGNVDDQAVWLDPRTVAYSARGSVWSVPADGTGTPRLLVRAGSSPVLVS